MENQKRIITIETSINAPIEKVWESATLSKHIKNWIFASDDWHSPGAENNPNDGGTFSVKMASKDGSMNYDYEGRYKSIITHKKIEYEISEGREVKLLFEEIDQFINVTLTFNPEIQNPYELQQNLWQAILDNFKKYTETL